MTPTTDDIECSSTALFAALAHEVSSSDGHGASSSDGDEYFGTDGYEAGVDIAVDEAKSLLKVKMKSRRRQCYLRVRRSESVL